VEAKERLLRRLIDRWAEPRDGRPTSGGDPPPLEVTPPPILSPAIRREAR